ncbi:hypothetical protein [Undibacterium umbellatum]|uniref:Uncharacterized protein n=1 Tax=Undibacterium umbellatum TaxID=2762300 RepID=A0ABR6ZIN5_9BURK|nr:hypothetical protein [Undibacterium umbellatum]MBC3911549.1 hypothetical protein [Undibacterium umbellatum]
MNTTPTTINLSDREQQPIVFLTAYMYPSELQPLKEMLQEMMDKVNGYDPAQAELWGGLCALMFGVKSVIQNLDSANSKAGA